MFSGSIASGDVLAVDVLTGDTHLVVDAPFGRTAYGLEQDRWGRLWVWAGEGPGLRLRAGRSPGGHVLSRPAAATFVNDVVMTGDGVVHRLVR